MKKYIAFLLGGLVAAQTLNAQLLIERRKDQFPKDSGYLVLPAPYVIPGIGNGVAVVGGISDISESTTDVLAVVIAGDVEGASLILNQLPVFTERLLFSTFVSNITKASANVYQFRGMEDNDKDDFNIFEAESTFAGQSLELNFWERRFSFIVALTQSSVKVTKIKDKDGEVIIDFTNTDDDSGLSARTRFDMTDDLADPRKGIRLDARRTFPEETSDKFKSDFYVQDYSATFYFPVFSSSTIVSHYFQSDAFVTREATTDEDELFKKFDVNNCADECSEIEDFTLKHISRKRSLANKNGTATPLGGTNLLRAYPNARFVGAHSALAGVEWRWNLTDSDESFSLFSFDNIRLGLQMAFFYEEGTVSETSGDLWAEKQTATGASFRLVSPTGAVYRLSAAQGEEGSQAILFFNYPWG